MKELSIADRPREKLLRLGAAALGDNELLALVLASGWRRADALALANDLLRRSGGLHQLARSAPGELARIEGVGPAKASQVVAALELGRRTLTHRPGARLQLRTPRDTAAFLLPAFGSRPTEQFGVVLLDTKHRVLKTTIVATGTLNSTIVEPRDVFREAVIGAAAAVIVFHTHPSGDPTPSPHDAELTRRLVAAGRLMGVELVDHVVLGDARYCSFMEMGQI